MQKKTILSITILIFLLLDIRHGLCAMNLRVQLGCDSTRAIQNRFAEKKLNDDKKIIKHLKEVAKNGFKPLSPQAKKLLAFPLEAEWGSTLTPEVYYELCNYLLASRKQEDVFVKTLNWQESNNVFIERSKFLDFIIHIAVLKELEKTGVSLNEKQILSKYISFSVVEIIGLEELERLGLGSGEKGILFKYACIPIELLSKIKLSKDEKYVISKYTGINLDNVDENRRIYKSLIKLSDDKGIVYRYCAMLYEINFQATIWQVSITGPDFSEEEVMFAKMSRYSRIISRLFNRYVEPNLCNRKSSGIIGMV